MPGETATRCRLCGWIGSSFIGNGDPEEIPPRWVIREYLGHLREKHPTESGVLEALLGGPG